MARKIRLEDRECPLSATLGLVGEWWTLLILHDAFDGYSRFDQFQENLGISSSLLTSRLKRMVGAGLQTGAEAEPVLIDRATGRRVDGPDFVFTAGPAASRPFQDRYAAHPKPPRPK